MNMIVGEIIDGWHYNTPVQPDPTPYIVGLLFLGVLGVMVVIVGLIMSAKQNAEKQKQFANSLNSLDKQLTDGKISSEMYKEMRYDLEERYKKKWYE